MSVTNFKTNNETYRKLMGNGLTYRIPRFQRDYSWTEVEWEDLWQDFISTMRPDGERAHYMGYLVLQSDDEKVFDVIDGQQRLTTISLIILAILKKYQGLISDGIDKDRNQQRLDHFRNTYIGYLDPVTYVSRAKLTLNRHNDSYYQTYIVPLQHLPLRGHRASEQALRKAFEWFYERVGGYLSEADGEPGQNLALFVENLADKLFFTVITVTDELNAYKVFETLNARGVRLSATDLLKNYLFSVLHRESQNAPEMTVLESRWEAIVGRLSSESFPDFLRIHWNSRHAFVRQSELFKTIRAQVKTRGSVFELIRDMDEDLDIYMSLAQPETASWTGMAKHHAACLRLFGVRQPLPLLLASHRKFSTADFEVILRACVVISFRYNIICGYTANEQERVYNNASEGISNVKLTNLPTVMRELSRIYPPDKAFRAAFSDKVLRTTQARNKNIAKYLLCCIEDRISNASLDPDSDALSLEHILPENPESGWDSFSTSEVESLVYRLGNFTILRKSSNNRLGNAAFIEKKTIYAESAYMMTKKLAEDYDEWTPSRLATRQNWMAKEAQSIWRMEQLEKQ
jgi:hypothetical protein